MSDTPYERNAMGAPSPYYGLIKIVNPRRNRRAALCSFIFLSAILGFPSTLASQTISPQRQALLGRRGELLKETKTLEQKKAEAQATVTQGSSLRDMAKAANKPDQANTYAEAVGVAQQAIAAADKKIAEDQERLEAINHSLTWEDSAVPRAVATVMRGHVTVMTPYGKFALDPTKPVELGEHLMVGEDGFLELQLGDGSEMHLGPNTDFVYQRDVQGVYYQIFRGEIHKISIMGVRGANDEPTYRGLRCVAAVRGTEFTFEVNSDAETFTVFEGEIEVDPGAGRAKEILTAGQKLTVTRSPSVTRVAVDPNVVVPHWWEP
jgi:ferric-dicitrate binding protein FerR (iron transport regulator)